MLLILMILKLIQHTTYEVEVNKFINSTNNTNNNINNTNLNKLFDFVLITQ